LAVLSNLSDRIILISDKPALMETLRKKSTRISYPENKAYQVLSFMLRANLSQRTAAPRSCPENINMMTVKLKFLPLPIKNPVIRHEACSYAN